MVKDHEDINEINSIGVVRFKSWQAPKRNLPRLIVFCGPSAVGTGRIMDMLVKDLPDKFARTVSHTVGL